MFQCDFKKRDAPTFPPAGAAPSGWARARGTIGAFALLCLVLGAAARSPIGLAPFLDRGSRAYVAAAWWASIMLSSMPYVLSGACAAALAQRLPRLGRLGVAVAALCSPGCDCSLAGFAPALRQTAPAVAGFVLAWSAAAGPVALFATHVALGDRLLTARLAGAFVAATFTATLWSVGPHRPGPVHRDAHGAPAAIADIVHAGVSSLAASAAGATILLALAPAMLGALSTPLLAAVAGSLLSPCSTADAVLARVLVHGRASQAAFLIAAQCVDLRQLATLHRAFGARRALFAWVAGCAGCFAAALAAGW